MDCEKFDRVVLDLLYEELDQITSAAAKRHTEHCTRCRDILVKLRATREVGTLPLMDPPEGLELKILNAERRARRELPARQRFGRAVSVLAGYAMRPQLAMAALLLLVIGSSLVLLRARPGEQKSLLVTERGVPEGEPETVAVVPLGEPRKLPQKSASETREARRSDTRGDDRPTSAAPVSGASKGEAAPEAEVKPEEEGESLAAARAVDSDRAYADALTAYRDRRYEQAEQRFAEVAERGGENAASAALYSAQAARARAGCPTAAPLFESVAERYPDSQPAKEAIWQAAGCYRTLGDFERARRKYDALLKTPGYADRAQAALTSLGDTEPELAARRALPAAPAKAAAKSVGSTSPPAAAPRAPADSSP